jgi:hypothetical protein
MKALIRVTRRTEYATMVDVTPEKYYELKAGLNNDDRRVVKTTEETLNQMINVKDLMHDKLERVDDFMLFLDAAANKT